jgi:hypothetical protein
MDVMVRSYKSLEEEVRVVYAHMYVFAGGGGACGVCSHVCVRWRRLCVYMGVPSYYTAGRGGACTWVCLRIIQLEEVVLVHEGAFVCGCDGAVIRVAGGGGGGGGGGCG